MFEGAVRLDLGKTGLFPSRPEGLAAGTGLADAGAPGKISEDRASPFWEQAHSLEAFGSVLRCEECVWGCSGLDGLAFHRAHSSAA